MMDGFQIAHWIGAAYVMGLATAGIVLLIRDRRLETGDVSGTAFASILSVLSVRQDYHPSMRANPLRGARL